MKKLSLILAILLIVSLTACGAPAEETSVPTTEAAPSALAVDGLSYTESGVLEDFQISGTISSNYALSKVECSVRVKPQDGNLSAENTMDPYCFDGEVNSVNLSEINEYIVSGIQSTCELYDAAADLLLAKEVKKVEVVISCFDESGNSENFTVNYTLEEAPAELTAVRIDNFEHAESGTADAFWVTGDVVSDYELVKVECNAIAKSDALGLSVSDTADPFYFDGGIYTFDMSNLTEYFVSQYESLYNLYAAATNLLGADNSVNCTLTFSVYDASGASADYEMTYILYEE